MELLSRTGRQSNQSLNLVYRAALSQPLIIEMFGTYRNNEFIDLRKESGLVLRRLNLNGTNLTASMVLTVPDSINHLIDYKWDSFNSYSDLNQFLFAFLF